MAVIAINYNEGSKKADLGYKSVQVSYANIKKEKIFASGNFVKDWYDAMKFMITKIGDKEFFLHSSTVNHFIMDGAKFRSAWLHTFKKEEPKLVYKYDFEEDHIEFFVPKGTQPTWREYRTLCGDPPKKKNENKKSTTRKTRRRAKA